MGRWFLWNVGVPLIGPPFFAFAVLMLWTMAPPSMQIQEAKWIDITPWAILTYVATLTASNLDDYGRMLRSRNERGGVTYCFAGFNLFVALLFSAFITVWSQVDGWRPISQVYLLCLILLGSGVVLCYILQSEVQASGS